MVARGPRFGDWYRGLVSSTNDDWESEWADYDELMDMVPRKRLTMGWEDDAWARGGVRLLLPPGWSWLDDLGDGVNCFVFFSYLLKIHGDCWKGAGMNKKRFHAQLLLGWEVNSTVLSETLFLLRHRSNCGDY